MRETILAWEMDVICPVQSGRRTYNLVGQRETRRRNELGLLFEEMNEEKHIAAAAGKQQIHRRRRRRRLHKGCCWERRFGDEHGAMVMISLCNCRKRAVIVLAIRRENIPLY
jgi:hypothetical protein